MDLLKKIASGLEDLTNEEKAFLIMDLSEQINDDEPTVFTEFQLFAKIKKMSKVLIRKTKKV